MKEKQKRPIELAVIFKKSQDRRGIIFYHPIDIKIGHLNNETEHFEIKNGDSYHYLLDDKYLYGFGLRTTLKAFKEKYQVNGDLKEVIKTYYKELKKYHYYFSTPNVEDIESLIFVAEDKKTHISFDTKDKDIKIAKKYLKKATSLNFDAKKLSAAIKKEVIGQDNAIDDIVTTIWKNFRSKNPTNMLLIGPTGVGKTEIIRNISKKLNVPMTTVNATDLSQTGYLGGCASDCIARLIRAANYDLEKASRGIVFIDEIDKKAGTGEYNTGVGTTGVQDELLKLLEDGDYEVNISNNPLAPNLVTINTKNITFICAGAFSEMQKKKNLKEKQITGFRSAPKINPLFEENPNKTTTHDLVTYGLKEELVGRMPHIIELSSLTKNNLISIMKNPNNKIIQDQISILDDLGIELSINEEVFELLADKALQNKTGARGLISAVENLFIKAMTEISQNPNEYSKLIIEKKTVLDPNMYILIKKNKRKVLRHEK